MGDVRTGSRIGCVSRRDPLRPLERALGEPSLVPIINRRVHHGWMKVLSVLMNQKISGESDAARLEGHRLELRRGSAGHPPRIVRHRCVPLSDRVDARERWRRRPRECLAVDRREATIRGSRPPGRGLRLREAHAGVPPGPLPDVIATSLGRRHHAAAASQWQTSTHLKWSCRLSPRQCAQPS
jgi:hypothetical protein